jgi:hypothetical protein
MLMTATTSEKGKPYDDLDELYGRMWGQWTLEMNHVTAIIGGFEQQQKNIGQEGVLFTPVAKAHQQEAVKFLNDKAFSTPTWALKPEILRRIEATGVISQVRRSQNSVLNSLLNSGRFTRLVEQEALDGATSYAPADFLTDVRKGVWAELDAPSVKVNAYRRNLQQAYLVIANTKVNGAAPAVPAGLPAEFAAQFAGPSDDEKALYRAELRSLSAAITAASAKASDRASKAHLEASKDQIARILDPKFAASTAAAAGAIRIGLSDEELMFLMPSASCWPDYAIRP